MLVSLSAGLELLAVPVKTKQGLMCHLSANQGAAKGGRQKEFDHFFYVAFVLLEAPKTPENSSRSKVGPEVGFGGSLKVGQK